MHGTVCRTQAPAVKSSGKHAEELEDGPSEQRCLQPGAAPGCSCLQRILAPSPPPAPRRLAPAPPSPLQSPRTGTWARRPSASWRPPRAPSPTAASCPTPPATTRWTARLRSGTMTTVGGGLNRAGLVGRVCAADVVPCPSSSPACTLTTTSFRPARRVWHRPRHLRQPLPPRLARRGRRHPGCCGGRQAAAPPRRHLRSHRHLWPAGGAGAACTAGHAQVHLGHAAGAQRGRLLVTPCKGLGRRGLGAGAGMQASPQPPRPCLVHRTGPRAPACDGSVRQVQGVPAPLAAKALLQPRGGA